MSVENVSSYKIKENLVKKKINREIDLDWDEIAKMCGETCSSDHFRKTAYGIYEAANYYDNQNNNAGNDDFNTTTNAISKQNITMTEENNISEKTNIMIDDVQKLNDYEYLLKLHGYNPKLFKVINAKNSIWEAQVKDVGVKQFCSSKITVVPKECEQTLEEIENWYKTLSDKIKHIPLTTNVENNIGKTAQIKDDNLLIIPISDLHYNLLATVTTSGNDYNCLKSEEIFFQIINDVLQRIKAYNFTKIIFTIGGDMLNADNALGTTNKGTMQDNEKIYYDAWTSLYEMTIKAIELLKQIAPVEVLYIPANHDINASWHLAQVLNAYYKNDERVRIDTSILPRKYLTFGNTLFVFTHDADLKTLPKLIPDEARMYWSKVSNTEVFLQHLHHEQILIEENNMRIQRLPSLSAKSRWSNNMGYNSKRQNKSFIYNVEDGLLEVIYSTVGQ